MGARRKSSRKTRDRRISGATDVASRDSAANEPEPARRRHLWRWLAAIVVLLVVAGMLGTQIGSRHWLKRGQVALSIHRFDLANQYLEKAARLNDLGGQVELMLGRVAWVRGDGQASQRRLERAVEQGVDEKQFQREKELAQIRFGAAGAMRSKLPTMLQQTSTEDGPAILEAFTAGYLAQGSPDQAAEILAVWQQADSQDPRIDYWRGVREQAFGSQEKAIGHFREALRKAPKMTPARLALADLLQSFYFYPEARTQYQRVLQEQPGSAEAQAGLGIGQLRSGAGDEGEQTLLEFLASHPQDSMVRLALAEHYLQQDDSAKVIDLLQPLIDQGTIDVYLHYLLATALVRQGETQRGQREFEIFQRLNRQFETVQMLKSLYQKNPSDELARRIGSSLMECKWQEAGPWILKSIESDPQNQDLHRMMAEYLRRAGREDAAQQYEARADAIASLSAPSGS
jgi:tetratricopeptide (TPR) repeat protein